MRIRFAKRADGSAILRCERADGSVIWQRHDGRRGRFFPMHDLTHYAVETTLGLRRAFYGLLAEGWDFTDFGQPWPRGPLPEEGLAAELVVGLLDQERATGVVTSVDDMNLHVAQFLTERLQSTPSWRMVTDEQLMRARARANALIERWQELNTTDTIDLEWA
jgi:hypothetical protein